MISYKLDDKYADKDKIKFKITDGFFSIFNVYEIRRASPIKLLNDLKATGKSLRFLMIFENSSKTLMQSASLSSPVP